MTRVLLVKTSSLGDVIHALPAVTDAAQALPGIRFSWVVEEAFAQIPGWHPAVEQVIPVALRRWRKHPLATWRSGEWRDCRALLRDSPVDAVIDAQGLLKSAWLTRYPSAPVHGLDSKSARESIAARFYDHQHAVPRDQHAVTRVRQLFAAALGYAVPDSEGDYGLARSRLGAREPVEPSLMFLHGTTWRTKHWPELYWRRLAELVVAAGVSVRLPWGNDEERARAERIAAGLQGVSVLARLDLTGLARELASSSACVAVDTGPGHLAAALAVPTLSLLGPTNPQLTAARGRQQIHLASDFPCAPCLSRRCTYRPDAEERARFDLQSEFPLCFTRLPPEQVWARLQPLLKAGC